MYLKIITFILFLLLISPWFAYIWSKMARMGKLRAEHQFFLTIKTEHDGKEKEK